SPLPRGYQASAGGGFVGTALQTPETQMISMLVSGQTVRHAWTLMEDPAPTTARLAKLPPPLAAGSRARPPPAQRRPSISPRRHQGRAGWVWLAHRCGLA